MDDEVLDDIKNKTFEIKEVSDVFYNSGNFTAQKSVKFFINCDNFKSLKEEGEVDEVFEKLRGEIEEIIQDDKNFYTFYEKINNVDS